MFKIFISILIGFCLVACGGGGSPSNVGGGEATLTGGGTITDNAPTSTTSYIGTWKGTTYGGNGTFPDITLTLNADGSYSCSGYPTYTGYHSSADKWTPWHYICSTPDDKTATWDVPSEKYLRLTHNFSSIPGMDITKVVSVDNTTLTLRLPETTTSKIYAQFTKVP